MPRMHCVSMLAVAAIGLLLSVPACSAFAGSEVGTPSFRAAYMGRRSISLVPRMSQVGLNVAMVKFQGLSSPLTREDRTALQAWADACRSNGILFMPVFDYWGLSEKRRSASSNRLNHRGRSFDDTPCPLDRALYGELVHKRFVDLATISRQMPIAGALLDPELYAGSMSMFPGVCVCDGCWQKYQSLCEAAGESGVPDLPAGNRWKYLAHADRLPVYQRFTRESMAWMAKQTLREVRSAAPEFVLGVLLADAPTPFARGLVKGYGTAEQPVWVFSEATYEDGYTEYIPQIMQRFANEGHHVRFMPGLWMRKFPADHLAEQYFHSARASGGYWIYTLDNLIDTTSVKLEDPVDSYWQAIRMANTELDRAARDPKYKTALRVRPVLRSSANLKTGNLGGVQYALPRDPKAINAGPVIFRRANTLLFRAAKGDRIRFAAKVNRWPGAEAATAQLRLLGEDGTVLATGMDTPAELGVVEAVAPRDGAYAVVLDVGRNSVNLVEHSHPYSVDAETEARFMFLNHNLYVWKPAGVSQGEIGFGVDGPGEAYAVTVKTLAGQKLHTCEVVKDQTARIITGRAEAGEVLQLSFRPLANSRIEDIRVRVKSGFGPYVSPARIGLLRSEPGSRSEGKGQAR